MALCSDVLERIVQAFGMHTKPNENNQNLDAMFASLKSEADTAMSKPLVTANSVLTSLGGIVAAIHELEAGDLKNDLIFVVPSLPGFLTNFRRICKFVIDKLNGVYAKAIAQFNDHKVSQLPAFAKLARGHLYVLPGLTPELELDIEASDWTALKNLRPNPITTTEARI
jgi:hypothetical protein